VNAVLEAVGLFRFYHVGDTETVALRDVSITVSSGETVAVVGPSGSGKSTLVACLAGLDEPQAGRVAILGRRLTRRPEAERAAIRAAEVGLLLQSGNLVGHLSVADGVALQMRLAGRYDAERALELLDQVGLADRRHAKPGELSGGEAARAALAVALAGSPSLLLADEPTGEVDSATEACILELLDARRQAAGAALVVTHSRAVASHANRVVRLADGRIVDV
jgi:putative ABC transport system ATP-binding protein